MPSYTACMVMLVLATASYQSNPAADREAFLRDAEIVDSETIDTGITRPQMVRLERDGLERRAVFKSFDRNFPRRMTTVGLEQQTGLHDSWKFEVAAYELDQLLGLGMVPAAVVRELGGHKGALIDWVDGVLPEYETSPLGFSLAEWEDRVASVWLFDYLAYNIDRTPDNLLVTEGFEVYLIDHSRAFQRFQVPMRPLSRFPRSVIERLRRLEESDFRKVLDPYLNDDELEAFLERRERVLDRVERLLRERSPDEVLF